MKYFRKYIGLPVLLALLFIGAVAHFSASASASASESEPSATEVPGASWFPEFPPCEPQSEFATDPERVWNGYWKAGYEIPTTMPSLAFCAKWNPEFSHNGQRCCRNLVSLHRRKARVSCFRKRPRGGYCGEISEEQLAYTDYVKNNPGIDVLKLITQEMGKQEQAYCTANNGFLAYGRRLIPSPVNHIRIRSPERCTEFGTDHMIGMIEWLGRKIGEKYSDSEYKGVHLLIGDVAAPRGGCLSGNSGVRGHLSHTNGQDADVGYLNTRPNQRSPEFFSRDFDAKTNWWMIKQIMVNPYACVKVIFLDRRNIRKLAKAAAADEAWIQYRRFIRHQPGHRDHMHVRIGDWPGQPGCVANPKPELEPDDDPGMGEGELETDLRLNPSIFANPPKTEAQFQE